MNNLITTIVSKLCTENKFYANYRNFNFEVEDNSNSFDYRAERKGKRASLLVAFSQNENLIVFQYTFQETKDTVFYLLQDLDLKVSTGGGFTEVYLCNFIHRFQKETNSEITIDDISQAEALFEWKEKVKREIFAMKSA